MRIVTGFAAVLALAAGATSVVAAPTRLSDVEFIAANRCLGLMSSKALATPDAEALRKLLKGQNGGRDAYIYEKADQAREDAQLDASRGGAERTARLVAERDGLCHAFLSSSSTATTGGAGHSL
jgi:hypothetical protein